jgi:hypothetical protein
LHITGLEEENLDQKSPGPPGWGLMERASFSLIIKKQEMLKRKDQASEIRRRWTTEAKKRDFEISELRQI